MSGERLANGLLFPSNLTPGIGAPIGPTMREATIELAKEKLKAGAMSNKEWIKTILQLRRAQISPESIKATFGEVDYQPYNEGLAVKFLKTKTAKNSLELTATGSEKFDLNDVYSF